MIITKENIFGFCGTPLDVQITQSDAVDELIASTILDVEARIGRSVNEFNFINVPLVPGINCFTSNNHLYLLGNMRDVYLVTSIKENGIELSQYDPMTNTGEYIIYNGLGILEKVSYIPWATGSCSIVVSGKSQIQNNGSIKQAIVEIVGIKAGLWKRTVQTEGGSITTDQSLSNPYAVIDKYIQVNFL